MRHEADMVGGPGYSYLGHFAQRRYLIQGHNDIDASGKINDADDQNNFVQTNAAGNAPGIYGAYTVGSSTGNPL